MHARVRAQFKEQPPKVMLLASDTDADWIGASLMKALRLKKPEVEFCGAGGPLMGLQGLESTQTVGNPAAIHFYMLWQRRQMVRQLLRQALIERPDILIIVNASAWALSVAKWFRRRSNVKIYFLDAAGPHLAKPGLVDIADITFDTIPHNKNEDDHLFVGHPIFEKFAEYVPTGAARPLSKVGRVALMPSTFQTTQQMNLLSKLVEELREDHPRLEVVIPIEDGHNPRSFEPFAYLSANYVRGPEKYTALGHCDVAIASKDDSNLDLVALGVPMVLIPKFGFKLDKLYQTIMRGQNVTPIKYWGGEHVIPELQAHHSPLEELISMVKPLLKNGIDRKQQLGTLNKMRKSLVAEKKTASTTAASEIFSK